ncbi:MAG: hypothetical protein B7Y08_03895 [Rhodospirillales bacterium 24-66-33]|nr:MAG: hypothetical protein B7Y57_03535 [Rhodospirillales bacterium 35-66-84]OYZ96320.1 MAG: hypothetical protein B7Y08_03895 [Rhodospirillales bacterium 24-66-33]OZB28518.1 MAG: hypothetical protein B7X63_01245 [Rhodospirillales bacterium 39-66-50]
MADPEEPQRDADRKRACSTPGRGALRAGANLARVCALRRSGRPDRLLRRPWHFRRVQKVLTRAGVERVSHRGGVRPCLRAGGHSSRAHLPRRPIMAHAHADAFQMFRREANLEMLIRNGRLTASLLVSDVRVGDIVETAVTVTGSNPAPKGKFAGWVVFDDIEPFHKCRHRQLRPVDRPVACRAFNDPATEAITVSDGDVDAHGCLDDAARHEVEEHAVPCASPCPDPPVQRISGVVGRVVPVRPLL